MTNILLTASNETVTVGLQKFTNSILYRLEQQSDSHLIYSIIDLDIFLFFFFGIKAWRDIFPDQDNLFGMSTAGRTR
jgi:hypothetical protein